MNQELALEMVADLKSELPVPEETCPIIDAVIRNIKASKRRLLSSWDIDGALSNLDNCLPLLEILRKDNHNLRELGKEWHKLADDFAHQFES